MSLSHKDVQFDYKFVEIGVQMVLNLILEASHVHIALRFVVELLYFLMTY